MLGSERCDCGDQLRRAIEIINDAGKGVLVYMHQEGRGIGLANKIRAYALQDQGRDTVEANLELGFKDDGRDYGLSAQILRDLGVTKVWLMTNNPKKIEGLVRYGLEVVERHPIEIPPHKGTLHYLRTKQQKLGHLFTELKTYQHLIRANAVLRDKGLLRDVDGQVDCDAWVVAEGGTAMVYVTRESKREATLKALKDAFTNVPGIAKVILPAEYAAYGYPGPAAQPRMSDMVLAAASGYAFDPATKGEVVADVNPGTTPGNHGYLNSDPEMDAILVAWGAGIRPGSHVGVVPNLSIAPTIARLLGVPLPGTTAPALAELLQ